MPQDAIATAAPRRCHLGGRPRSLAPREARVTVRFSASELALVADATDGIPLSEVIRDAALRRRGRRRVVVPAVNGAAWQALARSAGNLNQLARAVNGGAVLDAAEIEPLLIRMREEVQALRRGLIGLPAEEDSG
ncbi:hypothetical protein T8K17_05125 [Thalassobaculum sp. OXR-137]|uniref:hypothetical protein n=1 Tax=Thalassobaculum sp. OXR-137 TaxID=3100173 RepID=UPI002AC96004|nr:hypothetical protein [Thalassobaculum sp. OXR-137]WPZ35528.1 hypothetical protein T8K17_05125 [Thalassobaculum sp. OXR-137]